MLQVRHIENDLSLIEWYRLRERIDFEPTYQRKGGIWGLRMKQLFINTILNRYDFPKVYLADFSGGSNELNQKKKQFAVIDGKQRLSTIFSFIDNEFKLDNTPIYYDKDIIYAGGCNFELLQLKHPELIQRLEDYIPTVMGVESDRIEDVYEMFIRLNINVHISGPERRNALPGPIPSLIRKIALHDFFITKAKFVIDTKDSKGKDRGQDLQAAAKILSIEFNGGTPVSTKKADLDLMVEKGTQFTDKDLMQFVEKATTNLDKMNQVFNDKDDLLAAQTQFPVYYIFIRRYYSRASPQDIYKFFFLFERQRRQVKRVLGSRAKGQTDTFTELMDEDFISFNSLVRSPDDKVSIESMLRIMDVKFNYFKQV